MYAEFIGAIYTIEHAWNARLTKLWMECDSVWFAKHFHSRG